MGTKVCNAPVRIAVDGLGILVALVVVVGWFNLRVVVDHEVATNGLRRPHPGTEGQASACK